MIGATPHERAYLTPFVVFLGLLLLGEAVRAFGDGYAHWALATPQYWIFPLQTVVCAALLGRYWGLYELRPIRGLGFAAGIGTLAVAIWTAPQWLFGLPPRHEGFDPERFGEGGVYVLVLGARLVRMAVIVPLIEELFWRGFVLRYFVREDFHKVPFGTFTWRSFIIVSVAFCFEHTRPDWLAAFFTSALYNLVAYRTRSLVACILAHSVTNILLGLYILKTRQWGFW